MEKQRLLEILEAALPLLENALVEGDRLDKDFYICDSVRSLLRQDRHNTVISAEEMDEVHDFLNSQVPTKDRHAKFYRHPLFNEGKRGRVQKTGWWKDSFGYGNRGEGRECQLQRIKFLKHLISILKVDLGIPLG